MCAVMLIETLTGRTFTPEDACKWSMERGYKALNQGTYYSYFKPQFAAFGIGCDMLNWTSTYGKPNHTNHDKDKALELLKQGYYLIALMNKGNWTSSGHFYRSLVGGRENPYQRPRQHERQPRQRRPVHVPQ